MRAIFVIGCNECPKSLSCPKKKEIKVGDRVESRNHSVLIDSIPYDCPLSEIAGVRFEAERIIYNKEEVKNNELA